MVWRETGIMDERLRFVGECLEDEETMTELCAAFGISRKTGYKWLGRYREFGAGRACAISRGRRCSHGRATAADVGGADRGGEGGASAVGSEEADGAAEAG